jgi:hypothetical protein
MYFSCLELGVMIPLVQLIRSRYTVLQGHTLVDHLEELEIADEEAVLQGNKHDEVVKLIDRLRKAPPELLNGLAAGTIQFRLIKTGGLINALDPVFEGVFS